MQIEELEKQAVSLGISWDDTMRDRLKDDSPITAFLFFVEKKVFHNFS